MTKGAYVVPLVERMAQAQSENQKRGKVRPISNRYYIRKVKPVKPVKIKKVKPVKPVKPVRQWIEWINEAGRTVRKLAP